MKTAELETIPLFAKLPPDARARVAEAARPIHLDAGQVIVGEGEFAFDFYAIKTGAAEVRQGGERVNELRAGDFLGEMGVVPQHGRRWSRRRRATVITTEPTDAIAIEGSEFRRLTEEIPSLGEAIRAVAAEYSRRDEMRRADR